jgi:thioredoxin-like negative regulator of GroEL
MTTKAVAITFAVAVAAALLFAPPTRGEDKAAPVAWTGKCDDGAAVAVPPDSKRPTVALFVMPSQPRTHDAIVQLTPVLRDVQNVQVLVVVSGASAAAGAARVKSEESCTWPVVIDRDYGLSGLLNVHAWPTTVLVSGQGEVLAHVAGLPKHYAKNMETHLAFAAGKIDRVEFEKRLASPELIVDDPKSMASRHLQVAQRLLEKGLVEQARVELEKSLRLNPDSPTLQLALVRALLTLGDVDRAGRLLDDIDTTSVSPLEVNLLRGRVLAGQGKDAEAVLVLQKATRLNPNPAEAWYELGLAYERQRDWTKATEAFRKAFETTETGRKLRPSPK